MKDEVRQTPGAEEFILHPSSFTLRSVCLAGGKTLRAAVGLPRKALLCARPRNVVLAFGRVTGSVRDYVVEPLSRNVKVALGRVTKAISELPSVFTEKGK